LTPHEIGFGCAVRGGLHVLVAALVLLGSVQTAAAAEVLVPEPSSYRTDDYNKPVPKTLAGVKAVIGAETAKALMGSAVFIDVYPRAPKPANLPPSTIWREPPHRSIKGAKWVPNVGFGALSPAVQAYFEGQLKQLSGGDMEKPLVIFCLRDCWMSWNAAKRALSLGYTSVYWFSEGTDAWEEAGYDLAIVDPVQP
jgi:PQQ-dependent catabolism-associated CXXCW motif protein